MKYIKRRSKRIELFVEVVFLIALFIFALLLDYELAASLFWQFYLVMAFLALILLLPVFLLSRRKQELWLFLGFNLSILALQFLVLSPVKPFTKFYLDINNGMTIEKVQQLFTQHFPKSGEFRQPDWRLHNENRNDAENHQLNGKRFLATPNQSLQYNLDLTDGRYDAEVMTVYFKDGKVVGTNYSAD
ncbi:hypothetical protein [Calothrix sp. PCC 6303]|uniref:hypothetical protein n=1 Tax=Calothrix sp. PCC 6303 TaxID=1170562 RepID=UPI0002A053FA|nr:hypothetical protein [Calothrix sp. PCC 6303]AFZ03249.1 hypothetical protein Cal6303_4342 [Calothrix sp. PCC 6303]